MNKRSDAGASSWVDSDDAPEITDEDVARADVHVGGEMIRRGGGRPKAAETREQIALRVDRRLLERYRETGPGWQTRMHMVLTLMDRFGDQIQQLQDDLAAVREGWISVSSNDGSGWRNVSEDRIDRIEKGIAELRRAIATLGSPSVAGTEAT